MRTYEDAIKEETELLARNVDKLNSAVHAASSKEVLAMIEKLRTVEKKMSLVFTFFKASLYANNTNEKDEEPTNRPSFN